MACPSNTCETGCSTRQQRRIIPFGCSSESGHWYSVGFPVGTSPSLWQKPTGPTAASSSFVYCRLFPSFSFFIHFCQTPHARRKYVSTGPVHRFRWSKAKLNLRQNIKAVESKSSTPSRTRAWRWLDKIHKWWHYKTNYLSIWLFHWRRQKAMNAEHDDDRRSNRWRRWRHHEALPKIHFYATCLCCCLACRLPRGNKEWRKKRKKISSNKKRKVEKKRFLSRRKSKLLAGNAIGFRDEETRLLAPSK